MHPRVEGLAVPPRRDDEHLVASLGPQDLHADKPGETLNVAAALAEPRDDPVDPPSLTERLLKMAITPAPGSTGDHDSSAADALGHLERLEGLAYKPLGVRPVCRILRYPDVHLEAIFVSG